MTLPAPNLDDRRFQDLVDDAKRLVQQRCPEWTDHNVSDPGVTLIETVAYMVDQLIYRLNRVPERNYIKFLELIGVRLFPPTAATADVTFWLSAPQPQSVTIRQGTAVSTIRTEQDEAITFTVTKELEIVPSALAFVASSIDAKTVRNHTDALGLKQAFAPFDATPKPEDVFLIGLTEPVPSCAVLMRFECSIEGVGVDPRNPPLVWEAWDGDSWVPCELERDETGGLNRPGDVVVHVPGTHQASVVNRLRAGWLRCRVLEAEEGQPRYSSSPKVHSLSVATIGGTAPSVNGDLVEDEILGTSEGLAGQTFAVKRFPIVRSDEPTVVDVATDGWVPWTEVDDFAQSADDDRHFVVDAVNGEVRFGPAVREADGTLRQFGAMVPKDAAVRIHSYRTGGGRRGNVTKGAICIIKSTIPYVSSVENRHHAVGGVDAEDIENAKLRGPILMRTRNRAVTAEDYEQLAQDAAPEAARIMCVPAGDGPDAGGVRVLVVPAAVDDELGRLRFEQLIPEEETLRQIGAALDERRVIGSRVVVEPPVYQGVTIVARLRAKPRTSAERLERDAIEALHRYFHPITGGPDGRGWQFGRPVLVGEVFSVLQSVRGLELVEDARLFAADPVSGERGKAVQRIDIAPHALVFSYGHQVMVEAEQVVSA